jgi:hypothetical protein
LTNSFIIIQIEQDKGWKIISITQNAVEQRNRIEASRTVSKRPQNNNNARGTRSRRQNRPRQSNNGIDMNGIAQALQQVQINDCKLEKSTTCKQIIERKATALNAMDEHCTCGICMTQWTEFINPEMKIVCILSCKHAFCM